MRQTQRTREVSRYPKAGRTRRAPRPAAVATAARNTGAQARCARQREVNRLRTCDMKRQQSVRFLLFRTPNYNKDGQPTNDTQKRPYGEVRQPVPVQRGGQDVQRQRARTRLHEAVHKLSSRRNTYHNANQKTTHNTENRRLPLSYRLARFLRRPAPCGRVRERERRGHPAHAQ